MSVESRAVMASELCSYTCTACSHNSHLSWLSVGVTSGDGVVS